MTRDTRAVAAAVIAAVLRGRSLKEALPQHLEQVSERDRALLQQLCYGTLRLAPRLQALLELLLDKPLREREWEVRALLLLGLYQLEATRVPEHAAVAATVDAAAALHKPWARGLINAVLRRYTRERDALSAALDPAAADAHPAWLHRELHRQWPGQAARILAAGNQAPPMTLRVNRLRLARDAYLDQLAQQTLPAHAGRVAPDAVYLERAVDVQALPGFASGEVSVQDESAQLAAPLLAATAGERVLDACAAPGGKTCHILELQPALAALCAMDSDPRRLARVADNLSRLGLSAATVVGDAVRPPPAVARERFERILVDAPCSASGVLRRNPDVKLLRREADLETLAARQLDILRGVWTLLKPGGTLLYATCSVLEQENSAVVARLLEQETTAEYLPLPVDWGLAVAHGRQVLPDAAGGDGLYFALLRRRGG